MMRGGGHEHEAKVLAEGAAREATVGGSCCLCDAHIGEAVEPARRVVAAVAQKKSEAKEAARGAEWEKAACGKKSEGRWSKEEHSLFLAGMIKFGYGDAAFTLVAGVVGTRTGAQTRSKAQKWANDIPKKARDKKLKEAEWEHVLGGLKGCSPDSPRENLQNILQLKRKILQGGLSEMGPL